MAGGGQPETPMHSGPLIPTRRTPLRRLQAPLILLVLMWQTVHPVSGQRPLVGSNLGDEFVDRDAAIEVTFDRAALGDGQRLAVFAGGVDLTDLFDHSPAGLRYAPAGLPLEPGPTELVVYLVEGASVWTEVGRFPLRVRGRLGFEEGSVDPSLAVSYTRPISSGMTEDPGPPEADPRLDLQLSVQTEHVRQGLVARTSASFVGVADQTQALRFAELQGDAPRLDLSRYSIQVGSGPLEVSLGSVSLGSQRHLINGFSSRGASAAVQAHERVDLSLGLVNGSNVVGYGNPFGMSVPDHRVMSGSIGIDALSEPGRLRLEFSGMNGSVLPISNVNQGSLTDAERSRGAAVRLQAHGLDRRVRLDLGLARSAFENPPDPELEQGLPVVPVIEETRSARYLEASLDALRGLSLGGDRTARVSLGYRHERVDPQYRSLGAYAQADRMHDQFSLQANLAGLGIQAGQSQNRDNLADLPSLLTTDTRRSDLGLRAPVGTLLGAESMWLPSLGFQWNRTHQAGRGVPVNGGFNESHVPDQVSRVMTVSADWNGARVGMGVRWNRSDQDNRQPGRESADFRSDVRSLTGRVTPWPRVTFNGDIGVESSDNLERDERRETTRYGLQLSLQLLERTSLSLRMSNTNAVTGVGLGAALGANDNRSIDAQLSSIIPGLSGFDGQWFLRFAHNRVGLRDPLTGVFDERAYWALDSGLSVTFF